MASVLTRLRAATGRTALDRRLARGDDPDSTPELACRARVLQSWRLRHALAGGLVRTVHEAEDPPFRYADAAIPIARDEVLAARVHLLRAAEVLRAERPTAVRGIAAVSLLLTDATGPLLAEHPAGTLREAAFRAAHHLEAG